MKDFFISYNRHDKQWAEWIAWTLEEAGYTVVVEVWDFQPGGNFVQYMDRAVKEAKQTIAVLSEHFLQADFVHSEWSAAFNRDPQGLQRTLIPVRVSECDPEGLLKQLVYVDLVGVTEAEAHDLLLSALKERAKPDQKPSFPGAVTPKEARVEPERVEFPGTTLKVEAPEVVEVPTVPEAFAATDPNLVPDDTTVFSLTRRQLNQWLVWGGAGVGSLELSRFFLSAEPKIPGVSGIKLQRFTFMAVTVNAEGGLTKYKNGTAISFRENLSYGSTLEMVAISGGTFFMGAPETEAESKDEERPQRLLRVKPFFLSKYAVTQEQWFTVSELPKVKYDLDPNCSHFKGLKRPVEQVNWFEAVEFCDRLSQKTGKQYRLPSEVEWEYACRAGTPTPFHFGETITTNLANYCGAEGTLGGKTFLGSYGQGPKGIYRKQTTDVGSFPPNAFGLYDMHGNLWEWCADHWHDTYKGALSDGSAWVAGGNSNRRLVRGGSWGHDPASCRSAARSLTLPGTRYDAIGFRVVCSFTRTS